MNLISTIFSNYLFLGVFVLVIAIVIGNLVSSILKKGGEVALKGSTSLIKGGFFGIWYLIFLIFQLIMLFFSVLYLMAVYIKNKIV